MILPLSDRWSCHPVTDDPATQWQIISVTDNPVTHWQMILPLSDRWSCHSVTAAMSWKAKSDHDRFKFSQFSWTFHSNSYCCRYLTFMSFTIFPVFIDKQTWNSSSRLNEVLFDTLTLKKKNAYCMGGSNQQSSIFYHPACFGYFLQQSWILYIQNSSK